MQLASSRAGSYEPRAQTAKLFIISPQHTVSLCSHKPPTGWGSSRVSSIHGARIERSQQSLFFSHLDISYPKAKIRLLHRKLSEWSTIGRAIFIGFSLHSIALELSKVSNSSWFNRIIGYPTSNQSGVEYACDFGTTLGSSPHYPQRIPVQMDRFSEWHAAFLIRFLERKKIWFKPEFKYRLRRKFGRGKKNHFFSKETQPLFTFFPGIHKRKL